MKKRIILIVCLLLTVGVITASIFLPEMIIKGTDSQTLGKVKAADKSYSSNIIDAYSGELDLYRKVLLLKGIWKSDYTIKPIAHANSSGSLKFSDTQAYLEILNRFVLVGFENHDSEILAAGNYNNAEGDNAEDNNAGYESEDYINEQIRESKAASIELLSKSINIYDILYQDSIFNNIQYYSSDFDYSYGFYYYPLREENLLMESKLTLVEKRSYTDTALQKYSFDILVCTYEIEEDNGLDAKMTATLYWDWEENICLGLTIESTFDYIDLEEVWKSWLEFKIDNKARLDYYIMQPSLKQEYEHVDIISDIEASKLGVLDINGNPLSNEKENFIYKCYNDNEAECVYYILSCTQNTTELYYTVDASEP